MNRTPIYVVCSPRPQVGKTLLARLLTEFQFLQHKAVVAFDINVKEPSLIDYLPRLAETAEIGDTIDKMALMDRLIVNDGVPKVIDLGYHAYDEFFKMIEEIGFIKEAARRGVDPIILFIADSDRGSSRAYQDLQTRFALAALVPIDNELILQGEIPPAFKGARGIRIRALPQFLKTYINRLNFSFSDYLRTAGDTSSELHQWIRANYLAFREIELNLILRR